MHKAERRDLKRKRDWYKEYMANNRKSLEVIIQAQRDRARQARQTSSAIRPMRGRRR